MVEAEERSAKGHEAVPGVVAMITAQDLGMVDIETAFKRIELKRGGNSHGGRPRVEPPLVLVEQLQHIPEPEPCFEVGTLLVNRNHRDRQKRIYEVVWANPFQARLKLIADNPGPVYATVRQSLRLTRKQIVARFLVVDSPTRRARAYGEVEE